MEHCLPHTESSVGIQYRFPFLIKIKPQFLTLRISANQRCDINNFYYGTIPDIVVSNGKIQKLD